MAKFKFTMEAGCFVKAQIKRELERSKDKLEYMYPGSSVTIREEKGFFESEFFVQGVNFPDTAEFEAQIKNWERKLISASNC